MLRLLVLVLSIALGGCAGLPERPAQPASHARVAPADSPLGSVARDSGLSAGQTGLWPMPEATIALDTRFELIRRAAVSIDLQYYQVGNDTVGRSILRALRDAGRRGVRVRLIVDDLYTQGMDPLLLGLSATPNVEVRLFNPFPAGRSSSWLRSVAFFQDFKRLNQRMHNKLLVADGALAVVGGRNLADEYFFRSTSANFIDFDMLMAGAVVPQLSDWFDKYWNSQMVYPIGLIAGDGSAPAAREAELERLTAHDLPPAPRTEVDMFGNKPFGAQLDARSFSFVPARAQAWADEPTKAQEGGPTAPTVKQRFVQEMSRARRQLLLFSPYFIPGPEGVAGLRRAREHGVEVRVVTNSLAASDEPLVNAGYAQYRAELLKSGVRLFEVASDQLKSDTRIRHLLRGTAGRLHAKMAYIDGETMLIGSMNLDPRSEYTNNEIGVIVHSPEVTRRMLAVFDPDRNVDYEVTLGEDGTSLIWVSRAGGREQRKYDEPSPGFWQQLKVRLLWLLVPEDLL